MKRNLYVLTCALCTLLSLPAAAQVPAYVPTDGLVGWWPFNGNANDESGNGNDGEIIGGVSLTSDRFENNGQAFHFDGISGYIKAATNNFPSNERAISFWINSNNYEAKAVMGYGGDGSCGTSFLIHTDMVSCNGANKMVIHRHCCVNEFSADLTFMPLNNWNHVVYIMNSEASFIFINGMLVSSETFVYTTPLTSSDFGIGCIGDYLGHAPLIDENANLFEGKLDDIAIYNRALNEQEIQALYTGQCPSVTTNCTSLPSNLQQGLVGYWPFCGNANDESGNGNDGTVNGATLTEDRFEYSNKAYQFNGDTDDITIEVSSPVETNRSISFWAKVDSGAMNVNPSRNIIALGNDFNVTFGDWGENGKSAISVHSGIQWVADTTITDDGNWHFYSVIITSGNSDSLAFYQDGELLNGRINFGGFNCAVSNSVIKIGSGYAEGDNLNGTLDDIGIWNRALTPEEVQELYTLDACTFTVYDTTYVTVYDTVTTYVTVTDTLLIDITFTGIEGQPSWLNTVTVFPNPASDHITIDYGNFALMAGYNTIITDAAGATVYSSAVNSQQVEIDINAWGAMGVYYMSVYDANGQLLAVRHIVLE